MRAGKRRMPEGGDMAFFKKSKDQPPPNEPPRESPRMQPASAPPRSAQPSAQPKPAANGAQTGAAGVDMEELKAGFERSRRTLVALGEITSVLMRAPEFRNMTLASLQGMVAPAISTGQYMVLTAHQKQRGAAAPIALAIWAMVSREVDQKLSQVDGQNVALGAADWKSGDIAWLLVVAGDQRAVPALLGQLQKTKLKDKVIKLRAKGENGKLEVRTLGAAGGSPSGARQPQPVKH